MGWNGHRWDSPSVSILTHSTVGWDGMDIIGIPQCVHYFSQGGTVGWDGHLSDSGECPKNIRTIWDSQSTIGHLLAMLDMSVPTMVQISLQILLMVMNTPGKLSYPLIFEQSGKPFEATYWSSQRELCTPS